MSSTPPPPLQLPVSIPQESPLRGCSSNFAMPVRQENVTQAQVWVNTLDTVNRPILGRGIGYRVAINEYDVSRPLYRWDTRPYTEIMQNGFRARPQRPQDDRYYDLQHFIIHGGALLDSSEDRVHHGFVSTTLDIDYRPEPLPEDIEEAGGQLIFYRYEIFAPGGIWVAVTLRDRYIYWDEAEVAFVGGIAPQYIRAVEIYMATHPPGYESPIIERERLVITINNNFRPHVNTNFLVHIPIASYEDEDGEQSFLLQETYTPGPNTTRPEREVTSFDHWGYDDLEWYSHGVLTVPVYVNAAFRSSRHNQVYIFMKNEYVLLDYAPGSSNGKILKGPLLICDGFSSLIRTPFGEHGIDCAFDTDGNEAYIFCANLCALLDYAPGDDKILSGPMLIDDMFPCLKGTVFEKGIDAAYRSTNSNEVYIFTGGQYGRLNYASKTLIYSSTIIDGSPCLAGTIFESGIEAAFASHVTNEAYLFKGEKYVHIKFAPGTPNDSILGTINPIIPHWPALGRILPRKNGRLDADHHEAHIPPLSINAAFRSSKNNEAYIFMKNKYVLLNYVPGTMTPDKILKGPLLICDGFSSLIDTPFGVHGIDCAFDTDQNEAYIFSTNLCVLLDYAPGNPGHDKILKGPLSIAEMFPCLKGTVFEKGIDAAFRSKNNDDVYIFRGDQYGNLHYASNSKTLYTDTIKNAWKSLAGTIFESGVEAAFASHVPNQAYVFKGDQYACINFLPNTGEGDYMVGGKTGLISYYWPGIGGVLARKNGRLDADHHEAHIPPLSINAAFRSSKNNEAYIFMKNKYVLLNYVPGTMTPDKILKGPLLICDGFSSLIGTPFGVHGIDCAFDTDQNEAYIFSTNLCALLDYAPGNPGHDKILKGPLSIVEMFPCLKGTVFEKGIDAAFRSKNNDDVYIFRGDQYGNLHYASNSKTLYTDTIKNAWKSLAGTIFESGVEAAFASHVPNQAYVFKGDQYACINFLPNTSEGDYMVGGKTGLISYYWPGIGGVLARKNGRLDVDDKHESTPPKEHHHEHTEH